MKPLFFCIAIVILFGLIPLHGQNFIADSTNKKTLLWSATVSASGNVNQHRAEFSGLPGVPSCCPKYSDGSGIGLAVGGKFAVPIHRTMFAEMRVNFTTLNGTFTARQNQIIDNNGIATGIFEHTIDTKIALLSFEPTVSVVLWKSFQLHGGLSIGAVTSATYIQTETLLSPSDVVFENDSRVRNRFSDNISQVPVLQASLIGSLTYSIPITTDRTFSATPEITYTYGLTNFVSTSDLWKINSLRIGLGITYNFQKSPPLGTDIQLETSPENRIPSKR
jgi:hypothetical protein